jgi:exonuclease V gamma subunit
MLQLEKELRENLPVPSEKAKAALSELIKQTEDEPITEEFVDPATGKTAVAQRSTPNEYKRQLEANRRAYQDPNSPEAEQARKYWGSMGIPYEKAAE